MTKKQRNKTAKKDEVKELKNQLARALADYDNLTKRVEKERDSFRRLATLGIIARILPVYDMLEEAQEQLQDSGLAIIIKELTDIFDEEEINKVKADKGDEFDENVHEVIEAVDLPKGGKAKSDKITECVLTGWKYKDGPIIRPAKVKVGKK